MTDPDRTIPQTAAPPRWSTRAPGRLDVMGGIAEYTGSLVLGGSLSRGAAVTAQLRNDGRFTVFGRNELSRSVDEPVSFDWSLFCQGDSPSSGEHVARHFVNSPDQWILSVAGAIWAMRVSRKVDGSQPGATIVVDSTLPAIADAGFVATTAVAVLMVLSRAWGLRLDPHECAHLAMRVENEVIGTPCGISSALCALLAQAGNLTQICCHTERVLDPLVLPDAVTLLGIDCGIKTPKAREVYVRARVAAFMGRRIVERALASMNGHSVAWHGCLSQIVGSDYVDHLRDRIPIRMRGADFLERFGETADPLTRVDPKAIYKIRSRTEHHIYEAGRTLRFAERLSYAARTRDRGALIEAGKLMHASHWSYGQRCGLGSIETDRLVNLLRARGADAGIYGAKISAQGAGGVVVVLMDDSAEAREAVDTVIKEYERKTPCSATLLEGSSQGAWHVGVHES